MQVSPDFEDAVREWVTIDNRITGAQDAIKKLKVQKNEAGKDIMVYIKQNSLEEHPINITNGKLKLAISKTTTSVNKKYIENRLTEYFKSQSKAREITEYLFNNRETTEKEVLRRTKNRNK